MPIRPLRIAHRGMPRRARENTIPSFRLALAAGADGIELDVHATADGVVVVHHDPVTANGVEIARAPWAELRRSEQRLGREIPSLSAVCDVVAGRAELFVELKGAAIEAQVLDVLRAYTGHYALHSFDHAMIGRIARRSPATRLGVLFEHRVEDVGALLAAHGATDAWPRHSLVDERLVRNVHDAGGRVIAWTVDDAAEASRLARLGVDGICTDDVALLEPLGR
jgi:glycerophosphoryl diester phosphodiesterase